MVGNSPMTKNISLFAAWAERERISAGISFAGFGTKDGNGFTRQ
jgi:hypothetical protein